MNATALRDQEYAVEPVLSMVSLFQCKMSLKGGLISNTR